jgi:hypothetical protein
LDVCSAINESTPKPRFAEAVNLFNENNDADVRPILCFIPLFKKAMEGIPYGTASTVQALPVHQTN